MKLIQSFWTKPAIDNIFDIDNRLCKELYVIALSCWYAKNSGADLCMYTDDFGMQILDYLPYDDIIIKLNGINMNSLAFAYPKFIVMRDEPLGTIHIDNDVFIKSELCLNSLKFDNYDCIVQSKSNTKGLPLHIKTKNHYRNLLTKFGLQHVIDYEYEYNTGVLGFNNQKLKDEFINRYFKLIEASENIIDDVAPDILFEQLMIYDLINTNNYTVKTLVNPPKVNADDINYQHVLADIKWKHINYIKSLLNYYSPELYEKTNEKIEQIKNKLT